MIEELKRLTQAATPGRWRIVKNPFTSIIYAQDKVVVGSNGVASYGQDEINATLICAAVNALPALIAAAEAVVAYDAADQLARVMMSEDESAASIIAWREAEALIFAAAKGLKEAAPQPRSYDRAGCDVTNLPGLWDESDTIKEVEG